MQRARLVLSLYDQDLLSADDELGDGVVSLRELARTPPTKRGVAGVDLSIALFDPQSGARLPWRLRQAALGRGDLTEARVRVSDRDEHTKKDVSKKSCPIVLTKS